MVSEPSSCCKLLINGQVLVRLIGICHSIGEGLWCLSTHICEGQTQSTVWRSGKRATNPLTISFISRSGLWTPNSVLSRVAQISYAKPLRSSSLPITTNNLKFQTLFPSVNMTQSSSNALRFQRVCPKSSITWTGTLKSYPSLSLFSSFSFPSFHTFPFLTFSLVPPLHREPFRFEVCQHLF